MGIDPKAEQSTRQMLGHAIRHEFASAYIAIDVSDRWPTDADLKEIAKHAAQAVTRLDITEQEIYAYLARVALGQEKLDDVFSVEGLATVPLFATANLLLTFCPREKEWWEYLDQIWDSAEAADRISLALLPALILRAHNFPPR